MVTNVDAGAQTADHPLLLSQGHRQGAGFKVEVEQPGLELVCTWDVGTASATGKRSDSCLCPG